MRVIEGGRGRRPTKNFDERFIRGIHQLVFLMVLDKDLVSLIVINKIKKNKP